MTATTVQRRLCLAASIALILAGCTYNPRFEDCHVTACNGAADCPAGYSCDSQHFCRVPNATASCLDVLEDAGITLDAADTDAAGSASPMSCSGTANACTGFSTQPACNGQSGCSWLAAASCKLNVDCSQFSATACAGHEECKVESGSCVDNPFQCSIVTSQSTCESRALCDWVAAGCSGTPTTCTSITSSAACMVHTGCTWE